MDQFMRIGDLAELAGVTQRTVRYYESIGLLAPGKREGHGHHYYTEETLARLRKIDQLKRLRLSLEEIGFIGQGAHGEPKADSWLKPGYLLKFYNRTASKAEPHKALGAGIASRPADALAPGGIIVTVVSNDDAQEDVVMSEGFLTRLG